MPGLVIRIIEGADLVYFFFFQAGYGIRDKLVTGVQTCPLPISARRLALSMTAGRTDGAAAATWSAANAVATNVTIRIRRVCFINVSSGVLQHTSGNLTVRSEERRVGKECRSGWWADQYKCDKHR